MSPPDSPKCALQLKLVVFRFCGASTWGLKGSGLRGLGSGPHGLGASGKGGREGSAAGIHRAAGTSGHAQHGRLPQCRGLRVEVSPTRNEKQAQLHTPKSDFL